MLWDDNRTKKQQQRQKFRITLRFDWAHFFVYPFNPEYITRTHTRTFIIRTPLFW